MLTTVFPCLFIDDVFVTLFLRGCKYSLERTKEKVDMYFTMKAAVPEWFSNMDPEDPVMEEMANLG